MKRTVFQVGQAAGRLVSAELSDELMDGFELVDLHSSRGEALTCLDLGSILDPLALYPSAVAPIVRREVADRSDASLWTDEQSGVAQVVEWFFLWHFLSDALDIWPVLVNRLRLNSGDPATLWTDVGPWLAMGFADIALDLRSDSILSTPSRQLAGFGLSIMWREAGIDPPPW